MTFKRITFEAAVAYARGKEEQYRDHGIFIRLILHAQGVMIEVTCPSKHATTNHLVSWHELEHSHYDALRIGIDKACER